MVAGSLALGCESEASSAPVKKERPPPVVQAYTVKPTTLARTVEAVGSLRSPESTRVTAEIGGKVALLDVPEGKRVEAGHMLARLDTSEASADLVVAQARLEGAQETLERRQELVREQLATDQALDEADADEKAARGELARRRATLGKMVIRAPFAGVVGLREVSLGAYISPGTAITTLTSIDTLELVFSVPERHVGKIESGQKVRGVVGDCTHRFTGEVVVLEPAVDPRTRSLRVLARVERSDVLVPGMSAQVKVEVGSVDKALQIPQEALIRQGTREYVLAVGKDQTVERVNVTTGQFDARFVEIRDGLSPGDRVVAAGHQKARPGDEVRAEPFEPVDNPNLELGLAGNGADCWF
jgi:membrane fusion protein (multidrug efflux system)